MSHLARADLPERLTPQGLCHDHVAAVCRFASVIDLQDVAVKAGVGNPSAKPGTNIRYQAILASGWTDVVIPLK